MVYKSNFCDQAFIHGQQAIKKAFRSGKACRYVDIQKRYTPSLIGICFFVRFVCFLPYMCGECSAEMV